MHLTRIRRIRASAKFSKNTRRIRRCHRIMNTPTPETHGGVDGIDNNKTTRYHI